jgi:hypothetical protein
VYNNIDWKGGYKLGTKGEGEWWCRMLEMIIEIKVAQKFGIHLWDSLTCHNYHKCHLL